MGPIWGRQVQGGPHVGPMNLAIWEATDEWELYKSIVIAMSHPLMAVDTIQSIVLTHEHVT